MTTQGKAQGCGCKVELEFDSEIGEAIKKEIVYCARHASVDELIEAFNKMVNGVHKEGWQWAELSGYVAYELPKLLSSIEKKV